MNISTAWPRVLELQAGCGFPSSCLMPGMGWNSVLPMAGQGFQDFRQTRNGNKIYFETFCSLALSGLIQALILATPLAPLRITPHEHLASPSREKRAV